LIWELQIKTARAAWRRAKDRADNAEGNLDPELADLLKKLDGDLARDQRDYDLAWRLEKIRLDTATLVEGKFNYALPEQDYLRAFAEAGLHLEPVRLKETARLIQQSIIKEQLLAALEHWALFLKDRNNRLLRRHLWELISLADPDPWAKEVRMLAVSNDRAAIEKLADKLQRDQGLASRVSPTMLIFLTPRLPEGKQESWLRIGQSHHPGDFWCSFNLANFLNEKKPAEAIGYYYVALAIRPNTDAAWYNLGVTLYHQKNLPAAIDAYKKALAINDKFAYAWTNLGMALGAQKNFPAAIDACKKALAIDDKLAEAWSNLGNALRDQKNLPAAIDACKKALAIDDKHAAAWNNLGNALLDQKNFVAAIDAYKKALAIDEKYAVAWNNLGNALRAQKNLPAAIDAYKKALAIDDKLALAWYNLGLTLHDQNNLPAAIDAYKKALGIDDKLADAWVNLGVALYHQKNLPAAIDAYKKALAIDDKDAMAWCNLGHVLRDHGDFAAALKAVQKGHELGQRQPGWPYPSAAWVKHCQQLVTLEQKLPAVLKGDPAEAGDLLALADLCQRYKNRYRDSAALFARAGFPPLWVPWKKPNRYNAACAAALAAAGKGKDADKLDAKEKNSLRQEALQWLQADLAARARFLEKNPLLAIRIIDDLQHWQKDPDLAVVRDDKELVKLTGEERAAWQKFWTQVQALSKQARAAFNQIEHQGQLSDKEREQSYPFKMTLGKTYMINMSSAQFDTYLRLENDKGKVLAENNNISPQNVNSRIIFSCKEDGSYRIVATSFQQAGRGAYVLTVREFPAKKQ
jgi:tetratricopeptide (TPR) repeat protein